MKNDEVNYEPTSFPVPHNDEDTELESADEVELPRRKLSPYRKKQLDYKHQVRTVSSGNRGYRNALKLLPHLERRSFRRAQDAATHAALVDGEAELTSADDLKSIKRSRFSRLLERKTQPLKAAIQHKKEQRTARYGKHKQENANL